MRIEDILSGGIEPGERPTSNRSRIRQTMNENRIVTAVGAGAVAFAGAKYGVLKQIPGLGPVPAAGVTIILGLVLAGWVSGRASGTVGALVEGVGYGLVAVGAFEIAAG